MLKEKIFFIQKFNEFTLIPFRVKFGNIYLLNKFLLDLNNLEFQAQGKNQRGVFEISWKSLNNFFFDLYILPESQTTLQPVVGV